MNKKKLSNSDKFKLIRLLNHLQAEDKLYISIIGYFSEFYIIIGIKKYQPCCLSWNEAFHPIKMNEGILTFLKRRDEENGFVNFNTKNTIFEEREINARYNLYEAYDKDVKYIINRIKENDFIYEDKSSITEYIRYVYNKIK